jgi:hypothetical protein
MSLVKPGKRINQGADKRDLQRIDSCLQQLVVTRLFSLQPTLTKAGLTQKERAMRVRLGLFILLSFLVGCHRNEVDSSVTSCAYPGVTMTRTSQFINQVPATIVTVKSGSQSVSYQIRRAGNAAFLGSCNLPPAFAKDSLPVMVSGYLLTFPGLELMNLSPLPFEVTAVRLRK